MKVVLIDAFDFCRTKDVREGDVSVADLGRLTKQTADKSGSIHWSLRGGSDKLGHLCLTLSVSGRVRLACQRCLSLFEFDVLSVSTLVLAKDEDEADKIDALLADDGIDVIVASESFNVTDLIEDEVMLALPIAPKHEICPEHMEKQNGFIMDEKPSPFAKLKNLKQ